MNYLHYEFEAGPEDVIEVTLDKKGKANVLLLDDDNYQKYVNRQQYQYDGGLAMTSPVHLRPASQGHWHVVIDLGGFPGRIWASVVKLDKQEVAN